MILLTIPAGRLRWHLALRSADEEQNKRDIADMGTAQSEERDRERHILAEFGKAWPPRLRRLGLIGSPPLNLPSEWGGPCTCEVCTRQRQRRKESPNTC